MCAPFSGLFNEGCEACYKWMVLEVGREVRPLTVQTTGLGG